MIDQISRVIRIYSECVDLIKDVLSDIPDDTLIWKPGGDSRSIAEITRHIIRVDNILLDKINIKGQTKDTFSNEKDLILNNLNAEREYIISLIRSAGDDDEFRRVIKEEAGNEISLRSTLIHIIHHHLYHFSQIVYLRRVHDRSWQTPEKRWEAVVDLIAQI